MYNDRIPLYKKLEEARESRLLVYVTGDRKGQETQIGQDIFPYFTDHLDLFPSDTSKITLYLYTRGGHTLSAWGLVQLLRQFCKDLEVIVPSKAHSAGTLICLGANRLVMTKQATLGPIDPSVNTPLNPSVPGQPESQRYPVSVEAINGYIELAKKELDISGSGDMVRVLSKLAEHVHPLVLGQVYRTRSQIRMLGQKLLSKHISDVETMENILSFLISDSGSHDYTINRDEALEHLGLNIEQPDDDLYSIIKDVFSDITDELKLNNPFDAQSVLGDKPEVTYTAARVLIESIEGGSDRYETDGQFSRRQIQTPAGPQVAIQDTRTFEGWRHVSAT